MSWLFPTPEEQQAAAAKRAAQEAREAAREARAWRDSTVDIGGLAYYKHEITLCTSPGVHCPWPQYIPRFNPITGLAFKYSDAVYWDNHGVLPPKKAAHLRIAELEAELAALKSELAQEPGNCQCQRAGELAGD